MLPLLVIGALPASAAAAEMAAPFTVLRARGAFVRVDIGEKRSRGGLLRLATVVTTEGAVPAVLDRTERVCTTLCGEEDGQTCHFEAIVRAERPIPGAIAVLPGRPRVSDVGVLSSGPERPADESWIDAPGFAFEGGALRWIRFPDGVHFATTTAGRDWVAPAPALTSCRQRIIGPFVMLTCPFAEMLYEGVQPVALSHSDYTTPTVRPALRLRIDGVEAFLIRYGLKADVVAALLVKVGADWRTLYTEPDYATLC